MNADLAQRIALVAHGNAFLSGLIDRPPDLLNENSAFQHARSIEFRGSGGTVHRVDLWFSALARRGAKRLWLRSDDLAAEGEHLREVWLPSGVFISKRFEERQDRQIKRLIETGIWNEEEQFAVSSVMANTERPWRLCYDRKARKSRLERGMPLSTSRAALAEAVTGRESSPGATESVSSERLTSHYRYSVPVARRLRSITTCFRRWVTRSKRGESSQVRLTHRSSAAWARGEMFSSTTSRSLRGSGVSTRSSATRSSARCCRRQTRSMGRR
jgi:hypothetical protein